MNEVIVSMNDISKNFPGVKALDKVHFELCSGEVMALLGENGAGKSTLMKILSGVYTRDGGTMEIFGKSYDDLTPKQAQEAGVAIIHQELNTKEGNGGLIAVDKKGNFAMPFNSGGMFRGYLYKEKGTGKISKAVGIGKKMKTL